MKRLMISGLAAAAMRPVGAADMASLQQSRIAAGADKLLTENFEDMSLVFSTATKR